MTVPDEVLQFIGYTFKLEEPVGTLLAGDANRTND